MKSTHFIEGFCRLFSTVVKNVAWTSIKTELAMERLWISMMSVLSLVIAVISSHNCVVK